jgi:hypothetical protein
MQMNSFNLFKLNFIKDQMSQKISAKALNSIKEILLPNQEAFTFCSKDLVIKESP